MINIRNEAADGRVGRGKEHLLVEGILGVDCYIKFDCITYVPLRPERKRSRGYNQSECIASDISSIINVPCEELIFKIKSNHIQHELDFSSRIENVKGVYAVKNEQAVKGKIILLCDDIITTGSTLRECAKTLLESGAKEVYCCVIASVFKQDS